MITSGVAALGAEAVARIVKTIAVYEDFCHANDPHEEHDFGAFKAEGDVIFFKIDLYEGPEVKSGNGEPVVTRVLTNAGRRVLTSKEGAPHNECGVLFVTIKFT